MKLNIFTALIFLFIGCGQKAQNYNYELEDSDEAYVMDSWSKGHKEDYYQRIGALLSEFLLREKYTLPSESEFNEAILKKLKISVTAQKHYQAIPYHIFQKDSINGDASRLFIFPKQRVISLGSEFPLLNASSLAYYHSPDYKNLDHSKDYNTVLNQLILASADEKEIEGWLKDEQLQDLFTYLVCCFHYDSNEKVFRSVIEKIKNDPSKYSSESLQLLFYKDRKEIDHKFLSKIAKLDPDKKLQAYFREALAEEFNENDQEKFEKILNTVYR